MALNERYSKDGSGYNKDPYSSKKNEQGEAIHGSDLKVEEESKHKANGGRNKKILLIVSFIIFDVIFGIVLFVIFFARLQTSEDLEEEILIQGYEYSEEELVPKAVDAESVTSSESLTKGVETKREEVSDVVPLQDVVKEEGRLNANQGLEVKKELGAPETVAKESEERTVDSEVMVKEGSRDLQKYRIFNGFLRTAEERNRSLVVNGGLRSNELAVDRALLWLAHQQQIDGYWEDQNIVGGDKNALRLSVTSHALMAFLASGYTDRQGQWKRHVQVGLRWLVRNQREDGSWGGSEQVTSFCVMALAEAVGHQRELSEYREPLQNGVRFLTGTEGKRIFSGYRDSFDVGGFLVDCQIFLSLQRASFALQDASAYMKLQKEFERALDTAVPILMKDTADKSNPNRGQEMAKMFAVLLRFGFEKKGLEMWVREVLDQQVYRSLQKGGLQDAELVYYTSAIFFQYQGLYWENWGDSLKMITQMQLREGVDKGAWEILADQGARKTSLQQTIFYCLSLETSYRYGYREVNE